MAVLAATSLVTRLDIGHQSYVGNLFNRYWVEDKSRLRSVFASGILAALALAVLEIVAAGLFFYFGKIEWLSGAVPEGTEKESFRIAFLAYLVFWVAQGSVGGVLARMYQPAGLFARAQVIGIIYYFLGFVALIVAAATGASIAGAMLAQIVAWSACNAFMFWDVKKLFPDFFPWWCGGNLSLAWENLRASLVLTANGFVEQFGSSGLVLLIAGILAPVEVAVFTTLRTVGNTALQGISVILYPIMPDVVRYHFRQEPQKIDAVFGLVWCAAGSLICLGFGAAAPVLAPLYEMWTRHALPFHPTLLALLVLSVGIRQWSTPLQTYLHAINELPPQTLAIVLRTAATLAIAFFFLARGIAFAGLAMFAGEILAGIVYFLAARSALHGMVGRISPWPAVLSLAQILVMGTGLVLGLCFPLTSKWSTPTAVFGITMLGAMQWKYLDGEVKRRVLNFFVRG